MSNNGSPSIFLVLFHLFLVIITGGLWGVGLLIWYVLRKK